MIGAVNCVVRRDGQYIGENTDGKGFLKSLREIIDPAGKRLVMFGAGGAARAIGVECALAGATHFTIVNRSEDRGHELITLLNDQTPAEAAYEKWDGEYFVPEEADVVINATSIGLADAKARLELDTVIPNPPRTQLIRAAEAKGCRVLDGLGMLVNQGITGIEYWTGETVDGAVMRARLEELFGS